MFLQRQGESTFRMIIMVGKYVKQQLNIKQEAVDVDVEGCFTFSLMRTFLNISCYSIYNMVCATILPL